MKILKNRKIKDVSDEFNAKFPGLKIIFYKKPHKDFKGSRADTEWSDELTIQEVNPLIEEGEINLDPNTTVMDLEGQFEHMYKMHVQVFRQSGDLWLQTVSTDNWTLGYQNERGLKSLKNN